MTPPSGPNHRESYRVSYPVAYPDKLLPHLVLLPDRPVDLEDWSEIGVRFKRPVVFEEKVGDEVSIRISLSEGNPFNADGIVVWVDASSVAVRLHPSELPWKIIMDEQRAIAKWRRSRVENI